MMTKIIKVKKTSCKGKEFECTMRIQCNTPEENEAKHERYLAELERRKMLDLSADNRDGFEDTDGQLYTSKSLL